MILLPASEYEILKQTDDEVVVYDKIVDKLATWNTERGSWIFQNGSRFETINMISGLDEGDSDAS